MIPFAGRHRRPETSFTRWVETGGLRRRRRGREAGSLWIAPDAALSWTSTSTRSCGARRSTPGIWESSTRCFPIPPPSWGGRRPSSSISRYSLKPPPEYLCYLCSTLMWLFVSLIFEKISILKRSSPRKRYDFLLKAGIFTVVFMWLRYNIEIGFDFVSHKQPKSIEIAFFNGADIAKRPFRRECNPSCAGAS